MTHRREAGSKPAASLPPAPGHVRGAAALPPTLLPAQTEAYWPGSVLMALKVIFVSPSVTRLRLSPNRFWYQSEPKQKTDGAFKLG